MEKARLSQLPLLRQIRSTTEARRHASVQRELNTEVEAERWREAVGSVLGGIVGDRDFTFAVTGGYCRRDSDGAWTTYKGEIEADQGVCLQIDRNDEGLIAQQRGAYGLVVDPRDVELVLAYDEALIGQQLVASIAEQLIAFVQQSELSQCVIPARDSTVSDRQLHEIVFQQDPDRAAIEYYSSLDGAPTSLSYGQLHGAAAHLARELQDRGVHRQTVVIALPQGPHLYLAILGILNSGNAFCPLLHDTPQERIHFVCRDVGATVAITTDACAASFPEEVATIVLSQDLTSATSDTAPEVQISGDDLAYILYTSGSTGKPKGVMISHDAASTTILAHDELFAEIGTKGGDRMLQFANPTFDISIFEIFSAWRNGFTLVSADRSLLLSSLPEVLQKARVDVLELTPSVAGLLPDQNDDRLKHIKGLITIGEKLTERVAARWAGKLWNAYGPTEATLHATYAKVSDARFNCSNVGPPLRSCSLVVVDPDSKHVLPVGHLGELCIGGPQVARGYLNRDDLNQEAFVELDGCKGRWYRTGDLARLVAGEVYFAGRKQGDAQVKINGQRVELGELAHLVSEVDGIRTAHVEYFDPRVLAFVVYDDRAVAHRDLEHLKLPCQIKPHYIELDSIPTSAAGKTDRKALQAIAEERFAGQGASELNDDDASDELKQILVTLQGVLGTSVGAEQSLAKLGLDSLGAMKVVAQLRDADMRVSVVDVLEADSASAIEKLIGVTASGEALNTAPVLSDAALQELKEKYGADKQYAPCSPIQASMIGASLADPQGMAYYNHVLLEVDASLDRLNSAMRQLIDCHEILRTGFALSPDNCDAEFVQIIHPALADAIEVAEVETDEAAPAIADHAGSAKLNTDNLHLPALQIFILSEGNDRCKVSINIHHALYDAWSLEIYLADLQSLLDGKELGQVHQYRSLQETTIVSIKDEHRDFWRTQLEGAREAAFPLLAKHADDTQVQRASFTSALSLQKLDEQCRALGVDAQVVGQLAWSTALSYLTGEPCPAFAVTTSGRQASQAGIELAGGPFITTFPVCADIASMTGNAALATLRDLNRGQLRHPISYRDVLRSADKDSRISPDTLFVYQKSGVDSVRQLSRVRVVDETDRLEFKVMLILDRTERGLELRLQAAAHLLNTESAQMLLQQVDSMITRILATPEQDVRDLWHMPQHLRAIDQPQPPRAAVAGRAEEFFARTVQQHGDRTAISFYESYDRHIDLTFAELDCRSDEISALIEPGHDAEDQVVAICLDRSVDLYASIVAIHKAGAAYLCIEPTTPADRVRVILEQTRVKQVITTTAHSEPFSANRAICLDSADRTPADRTRSNRPTDLAYVIMTSGTTGVPKACAVTHGNLLSNLDVLQRTYPWAEGDRILQFASAAFDISIFDIFMAFTNGLTLVSCPRDLMLSDINRAIQSFKVTHLNMTPTALSLVKHDQIPMVKCIVTAGEMATKASIADYAASGRYFNGSGPTETTNVVTLARVTTPTMSHNLVGRIFDNSTCYILNEQGQNLPYLALGECCVAGAQVIRGYLHDAERTAKSFIESDDFGRYYRTGDLVRLLPDGNMLITGRADSQVKVRGHRVELGEITAVLKRLDGVEDAATIIKDGALYGFVYCAGSVEHDQSETKGIDAVRKALPLYMVPARVFSLDEQIPHTSSFKLDTQKLAAYVDAHARDQSTASGGAADAEWTEASKAVAEVFAKQASVDVDTLTPDTTIYDLGLDSISAIKIVAALRDQKIGDVSVADLMKLQSAAAIAGILSMPSKQGNQSSELEDKRWHEFEQAVDSQCDRILKDVDLTMEDVEAFLPCTPLQEGVLTESQRGTDCSYVEHAILDLQSDIDVARLRGACDLLVKHTPILRTCFALFESELGGYVQVVRTRAELAWRESGDDQSIREEALAAAQSSAAGDITIAKPPVVFSMITSNSGKTLLISLHHAVFDGWSLDLLLEDLTALYADSNASITRPALEPIFKHILAASADAASDRWSGYFDDFEPSPFPALSERQKQSNVIYERRLEISLQEVSQSLKKTGNGLQALLQTVWALTLSGLTMADDVCFATIVSGRSIPVEGAESAVAPLFNVFPVRVKFDRETAVDTVVKAIGQEDLRHLEHPHTPLNAVLKHYSGSRQPFDTIVILQKPAENSASKLFRQVSDDGDSNYAVMVEFVPQPGTDRLLAKLSTKRSTLSNTAADSLLRDLEARLLSCVRDRDVTPSQLRTSLTTSSLALTAPTAYKPKPSLIHSAFLDNVKARPDAIALDFLHENGKRTELSYGQLHAAAAALAADRLSELSPGAYCVVAMHKSPEFYVTIMAIWLAGAVYVPIDVATPEERLRVILHDLKPALLLSNEAKTIDMVSQVAPELESLLLDTSICSEDSTQATNVPQSKAQPADPAYILFTSGSTGTPKAVVLPHSAAVAAVDGSRDLLWYDDKSRWLQFAAATFDMSIYDILISWSYGLCLCSAARESLLGDLTGIINTLQVTHVDLTPSIAQSLTRAGVPSVEMMFCIGEKLRDSIIQEWGSSCVNVYGPTEAAMACSLKRVDQHTVAANIGAPFPTAQMGIFQLESDLPVPMLELGELCIVGPQLAIGYLNDEAKTRQAFFEYESTRYHRTGDLCRLLPSGELLYADRKDGQVKLRGQRIELEEISHHLRNIDTCPEFSCSAASVIRDEVTGIDSLVAFVSKRQEPSEQDCDVLDASPALFDKVEKELSRRLPPYMIPDAILELSYIPLSAAGKVNRRLLQSIRAKVDAADSGYASEEAESTSEVEQQVIEAVAEVAKIDPSRIKLRSSFASLGIDSIRAVQLVSKLRQRGFAKLSVVDVLRNTNVARLASRVEELHINDNVGKTDEQDSSAATFDKLCEDLRKRHPKYEAALPASLTQQNMIAQFLSSEGKYYYNHSLFQLADAVDVEALRSAWQQVVQRFSILRSSFVPDDELDSQYAVVINKHVDFWCDRSETAVDEAGRDIEQLNQTLAQDITRPSFRLTLYSDKHVLMSAHHAIFDAESIELITAAVERVLAANAIHTPDTTVSAARELFRITSETQKSGKSFWSKVLKDAAPATFPDLNVLKQAQPTYEEQRHKFTATYKQLSELCQTRDLNLQHAALVAWAKLLSALTGEAKVAFGMVLSGRLDEALAQAVVPCLTTVPVSIEIDGTAAECIAQTAAYWADALEHQFFRFAELDMDAKSIFDSIFVYQQRQAASSSPKSWTQVKDFAHVEVPISLELLPDEGQDTIEAALIYNTSRLPERQARMVLRQFEAILTTMLDNLDTHVVDLEEHIPEELLAIEQRRLPDMKPAFTFLHESVEHWARETPDAVALEFAWTLEDESTSMSYAELDEAASKLAGHLQSLQLADKGPIGICFDKCPQAFIAILAVLKVGSPFCCLDSSAPIDRRCFILEDSEAVALICGDEQAKEFEDAELASPVVCLSSLETVDELAKPYSQPAIDEDDLSYILYTSGSTGRPKGCCLTHRNAVEAMKAFEHEFMDQFDKDSRFLAFASFHFDVAVLEQFFSYNIGFRVCAAPKDVVLSDIPETIKKFGITHLDLTPQLAATLTREEAPTLRVFITGGEMLRREIVDEWGDTGILFNFYGPTELTIGCTAASRVVKGMRPSNIGTSWANCSTVVRKTIGQPVAALRGAIGELIVGGPQVARGYMNLPKQTKERFSYDEHLQSRVYHTGDLVRELEHNKSFDFAGRADSQVKIRGQRIETGEIDSVIRASSLDLRDVFTTVLKHEKVQKDQLVTFVVHQDDKGTQVELVDEPTFDWSEMLAACRRNLPVYMVPSYILALRRIPLTPNNKVDTKALAALFSDRSPELLGKFSASTTASRATSKSRRASGKVLKRVVRIIAGLRKLDVEAIKPESSVFELGFDSISIVALTRAFQREGLPKLSVGSVLSAESIADIAALLSVDESRGKSSSAFDLEAFYKKQLDEVCEDLKVAPDDVQAIYPCTSLVEGLLTESLQDKRHSVHRNSFIVKLDDLDWPALQNAFNRLLEHHAMLRSRFLLGSDGLVHVVLKDAALAPQSQQHDYPLGQALVDIKQLDSEDHFKLTIHHALYDGQSLDVILRDFELLYQDQSSELSTQTSLDEAVVALLDDAQSFDSSFWSSTFDGMTVATLTAEETTPQEAVATVDIGDRLQALCSSAKCTPLAAVASAWSLVLRAIFGFDTVTGLLLSGRSLPVDGIDDLTYPTFNTLPLTAATDQDSIDALLQAVTKQYSGLLDQQHDPLRAIKQALKVSPKHKLFDTVLSYQGRSKQSEGSWSVEDEAGHSAGFGIALDVTNIETSLELIVKTERCSVAVEAIVSAVKRALEGVLQKRSPKDILASLSTEAVLYEQRQLSSSESGQAADSVGRNDLSELGKKLYDAVSSLTESVEVSAADSFAQLGLDSVDLIKLSARLKKVDLRVSVNELLQHDTVLDLERHLSDQSEDPGDSAGAEESADRLSKFDAAVRQKIDVPKSVKILPTGPAQEGMLIESRMDETGGSYLNHVLLKLDPALQLDSLRKAIETTVQRNDILRTAFAYIGDTDTTYDCAFAQTVHEDTTLAIDTIALSEADIESTFRDWTVQNTKKASRIETIPFAVSIFKDGDSNDSTAYLGITIHHALYDGVSLDMFFNDINDLLRQREVSPRPPFSIFLHHVYDLNKSDRQLFWTRSLRGVRPTLFATSSGATQKHEAESRVSVDALRKVARSAGVTIQAVLQAAYASVLMQLHSSDDIVFGIVLAGRNFAQEADSIMGPCMNTVPLRARGRRDGDMLDYATLSQQINEYTSALSPFVHTPLRDIQKLLKSGPLFDALFVYQVPNDTDEKSLWEPIIEDSSTGYPLALECSTSGDKLSYVTAIREGVLPQDCDLTTEMDAVLQRILDDARQPLQLHASQTSGENGVANDDVPEDVLQAVCAAIAEIGKVDSQDVSSETNIFSLGLDSISAIALNKKLRKAGHKLSVAQILRNPTPIGIARAALAGPMDTQATNAHQQDHQNDPEVLAAAAAALNLQAADIAYVVPATAGQVYFKAGEHALSGARFLSNFVLSASDGLTESILRERWGTLVKASDILRTAFVQHKDQLWQACIVPNRAAESFALISDDSRGIDELISQFIDSDDFLLSVNRPQVRLCLLVGKESERRLLLTIHHSLYDALSLPTIEAALHGTSPSQGLSFRSFSHQLDSEVPSTLEPWRDYLSEIEPYSLSTVPTQVTSDDQLDHFSPGESADRASERIRRRAKNAGVTAQALLLALTASVLAQLSRRQSIVFGIYISGSSIPIDRIDRLNGPVVNVVPLRVDFDQSANDERSRIDRAAKQVHDRLLHLNASFEQTVSIDQLWQQCFGAKSDAARGGLVDVCVNILPSRSTASDRQSLDSDQSPGREVEFSGALSAEHVKAIRQRYRDAYRPDVSTSPSAGASQTEPTPAYQKCVDPKLDVEIGFTQATVDGEKVECVDLGLFGRQSALCRLTRKQDADEAADYFLSELWRATTA